MQEPELKLHEKITLKEATEMPTTEVENSAPKSFGGRFELLSVIGSGGMSVVYKARENESGLLYAIKVLKKGLLADEAARQRFEQEANIVQQIDHNNIVKVSGHAVTDDATPYLVMEWIDGITLAEQIKQHGPLPVAHAVAVFDQITEALEYAHGKGIVHRDIKPSNILLVKRGDSYEVKIMDFGIAKILGADLQAAETFKTETGAVIGSPAYMSPEQCLGEDVAASSDIYSLGCVMYETLTAKNPFVASTPVSTILNHLESEVNSLGSEEFAKLKIPEYLDRTVLKCLAKKPDLRFTDAFSVRQALIPPPHPVSRFAATVIDIVLVVLLGSTIEFVLSLIFQHTEFIELFAVTSWAKFSLFCFVYILYFTCFESSSLRATPGKCFVGLQVSNLIGGKAAVWANLSRAILACSALSWFYYLRLISDPAVALDSFTGSHWGILSVMEGWSQFFFIIYMVYVWLFVFCNNDQWHVDTLLGRRIVSKKAVKVRAQSNNPGHFVVPSWAVSLLGLLVIVLAPVYSLWIFENAWGNPAVQKDQIVEIIKPVEIGKDLTVDNLRLTPVFRGCRDNYNYVRDMDSVIGTTAKYKLPANSLLSKYSVNEVSAVDQSPASLVMRGLEDESKNDLDNAQVEYLKALRRNPKDRDALLRLAGIYQKKGYAQEMETHLEMANGCPGSDASELFSDIGDESEAVEALAAAKYALAKNPADVKSIKLAIKALTFLNAKATAEKYKQQLLKFQRPLDTQD